LSLVLSIDATSFFALNNDVKSGFAHNEFVSIVGKYAEILEGIQFRAREALSGHSATRHFRNQIFGEISGRDQC